MLECVCEDLIFSSVNNAMSFDMVNCGDEP